MSGGCVLAGEVAAVRAELARVDAKCATLAALAGAAAAFTATQVTGDAPVVVRAVLGAAGVVLAAATVVLLAGVLRPRLGDTGFRRYARLTAGEITGLFEDDQAGTQGQELQVLSRICDAKFRRLRLAVDVTVVGVVLLGVGTVAGVIA